MDNFKGESMNLEEFRSEIDKIDSEILKLLRNRMQLSVRLGRVKKQVEDREREKEILSSLESKEDVLVSSSFSKKVYRNIIHESKRLQDLKLKLVGFHGERGSFGEVATRVFDNLSVPISYSTFSDIFKSITEEELDYGIVPMKNSHGSCEDEVNRLLAEDNVKVIGEVIIPVHYCLMSNKRLTLDDVKVAYSDPEALSHCSKFISEHGLDQRAFQGFSNAAAVIAGEKPVSSGAIATDICSNIYGLKILKERIENSDSIFRRFLVVSRKAFSGKGDRCFVTVSSNYKNGNLDSVSKIFENAGMDATRVEMIPSKESTNEARFLIDFIANESEKEIKETLDKIGTQNREFKLLGCYRSWYS